VKKVILNPYANFTGIFTFCVFCVCMKGHELKDPFSRREVT
jgi:hypothetical protein